MSRARAYVLYAAVALLCVALGASVVQLFRFSDSVRDLKGALVYERESAYPLSFRVLKKAGVIESLDRATGSLVLATPSAFVTGETVRVRFTLSPRTVLWRSEGLRDESGILSGVSRARPGTPAELAIGMRVFVVGVASDALGGFEALSIVYGPDLP